MSPSPAGFNPFSSAMGRMTNSGGGGFIAEQRRMQFMLGMTHLQHQLGMERDAVQHEYDKGMAKAQGKQARKTLKAQSAANMERDTHQSSLKIAEGEAKTAQDLKKERGLATIRVSEAKRMRALPLDREASADRRAKSAHDRRMESIEESRATRELAKLDADAAQQAKAEKMFAQMMPGIMPGGQPRPTVPSLETLSRANFGRLGGQKAQAAPPTSSPTQDEQQSQQSSSPVSIADWYKQKNGQ